MPTTLPNELFFESAVELVARVRGGELSPVDLMRATLERIDAVNPQVNAIVSLRPAEQLLAEAEAMADRLARGEEIGPLAGLPLGVKDLEDTVGLPNTHGSLVFKDHYPERDTIQVERLKAAGAIVIGKTNTPEFGYTAFTTNRVYGTTRNPWNLERTPGGSSGGSAAAVAAGLLPLATASDGGGSVRIPASYTGLVGLKPTQGRIPWGPDEMLRCSAAIVSGPLTRSVRDAARWLDVTIGAHALDPFSLPHPGYAYQDIMERAPQELRIAYTPTLGYARPAMQVRREVELALGALEAGGHRVEPIEGGISDIIVDWVRIMASEDVAFLSPYLQDENLLDPGFLPSIELAKQMTPADLGLALRARAALVSYLAGLFAEFDLLATPTLPTVAFAAAGPLPFEVDGTFVETVGGGIAYTYPFNFSGNPAITLRAGLSDDRLPVGVQLVAPRFREDLLLQVAYQYEQLRPWRHQWPQL